VVSLTQIIVYRSSAQDGFVTGHDFSRAANAAKSTRALQAAEKLNFAESNKN
jgi:hypothetical protein